LSERILVSFVPNTPLERILIRCNRYARSILLF